VSAQLTIVGLGPAGLDRLPARAADVVFDPEQSVIVRTLQHPAAAGLGASRAVETCDDLYESAADFEDLYRAIADRVMTSVAAGPTVYAVPGSAVVGERAVAEIRRRAAAADISIEVLPGESFLDLVYLAAGLDPIAAPVKILDGRDLPDPLIVDMAMIITQVDRPEVLGDVAAELGRVLDDRTPVLVLDRLGDPDEDILATDLAGLGALRPGPRTTLFLDPEPAGWYGLVVTNRILRRECPWDRKQTHHSLISHMIEETYETVDVLRALPPDAPGGEPDYSTYAEVEEELGDLLLQVVFHATLAGEVGAFDVEEVAEMIRRKLVHRHPHVFGDVVADDADTVISNWEAIKSDEKRRDSIMDDIPSAMPALVRADKVQRRAKSVGFDWADSAPVFAKITEELEELAAEVHDPVRATEEFGDLLFAAVNLSRHLGVDPELALAGASDRFAARIRHMEASATDEGRSLADYTLEELDRMWNRAKQSLQS